VDSGRPKGREEEGDPQAPIADNSNEAASGPREAVISRVEEPATSNVHDFKELAHKPNRILEEDRLAFLGERLLDAKRKRREAPTMLIKKSWNKPILPKVPIPGPWPDSRFAIHNANLRRGALLARLVDATKPVIEGATFIGLDDEGEGLCINKGEGDRYQGIFREAGKI
jgi:hypothetical protein